jgi:hypothetical protein
MISRGRTYVSPNLRLMGITHQQNVDRAHLTGQKKQLKGVGTHGTWVQRHSLFFLM